MLAELVLRGLRPKHWWSSVLITRTAVKAGPPLAKAKKGLAANIKKKVFEVETDAEKLVSRCCGLNYLKEGGEEVVLKPDSEYPPWLFTMDMKRPEPSSHQMEPGTMEYFRKMQEEESIYKRTLSKKKGKKKKK